MTSKEPVQAIFAYTDYRRLLRDWFAHRKAANPAFSHRVFARMAGFKTSNFMHLVMTGRRNLTKESITKIALALKLKKREWEYFENLVFLNQSATLREKEHYLTKLTGMRKGSYFQQIGNDQFEYLSSWLHPAVRELACIGHGPVNEAELASRIVAHVTPGQVRESLELVTRLGLIARKADGSCRQTNALLSTGPAATSVAVSQYHLGVMALAADAIQRFKPEDRELAGMTLGVSRQTYERIRERMWEFRQEVLAMADDPAPKQVYQMNVQLFPLTKTPTRARDRG